MTRKRKSRRNTLWSYSCGSRPNVVYAFERRDCGGQVFVRWRSSSKRDSASRLKQSLGITIREPLTGRLDPEKVADAKLAVLQGTAAPNVKAPVPVKPIQEPTAFTLKAGFDLALDPERGKYGSIQTRRYNQMKKYRERRFGGRRNAVGLVDASMPWIDFTAAEARALWRRMADRHVASRGKKFGVDAAEGIVDSIYSVASWLRKENLIPSTACLQPSQWRNTLKEEWAQRTGSASRDQIDRGIQWRSIAESLLRWPIRT